MGRLLSIIFNQCLKHDKIALSLTSVDYCRLVLTDQKYIKRIHWNSDFSKGFFLIYEGDTFKKPPY
jgi:hypothetical protein